MLQHSQINSSMLNKSAKSLDTMEIAQQQELEQESKVGKILSESTQKAVITLVLSMLLAAAILDLGLYIVSPPGFSLGLKVLTELRNDQDSFD